MNLYQQENSKRALRADPFVHGHGMAACWGKTSLLYGLLSGSMLGGGWCVGVSIRLVEVS